MPPPRLPFHLLQKITVAIILAAIALCLVVFYLNYRATQRYHRTIAAIEHSGETFDLEKLLPLALPDSENFAAIPALKGLAVDDRHNPATPNPIRRRLAELRLPKTDPKIFNQIRRDGSITGNSLSAENLIEYLKVTEIAPNAFTYGTDSSEILAYIENKFPLLAEITSSTDFPYAQFTPPAAARNWSSPLWENSMMKGLNEVLVLCNMLQLRAEAAILARNTKIALGSIIAIRQLASATTQEPFLISHLVAITLDQIYRRTLWSALNKRIFNSEELRQIQRGHLPARTNATLLYVHRTEACFGMDSHIYLKGPGRSKLASPMPAEPVMPLIVARLLPNGWLDYNYTVAAERFYPSLLNALKSENSNEIKKAVLEAEQKFNNLRDEFLSQYLLALDLHTPPNLPFIVSSSLCGNSRDQQAYTAMALELYFNHYNRYPSTLQELVPEFIASTPLDQIAQQPLKYIKTEEGRYKLWSIGFDGVDNNGKVNPVSNENFTNITNFNYKGDWTWKYSPLE